MICFLSDVDEEKNSNRQIEGLGKKNKQTNRRVVREW